MAEKLKIIDPFTNIPLASTAGASSDIGGATFLSDLRELNVGEGNTVFRADKQGIWLGSNSFATAPFKVTMTGIMSAVGASISGFIQVGGAANDVNTGTTTINGGQITTNSISADKIVSGQLIVGTNVGLGTALSASSVGDMAFQNMVEKAKLGTTIIQGGYIITSLITASNIQTGTLNASLVSVTNLNASNITSGTLNATVIGAGTITATKLSISTLSSITADLGAITAGSITFQQTTSTGAKLRWADGSRIWTDSSGYQGFNALGGRQYFYTASNENMVLYNGAQAWFNYGISCRGSFNVTAGNDARFANNVFFGTGSTFMWGDTTRLEIGIGGVSKVTIGNNLTVQGYLYQPNLNYINLNGTIKTAVVPTSEGFNALYCTESPEVWFMDFIKADKKVDPMFKEVTVSPYHYIKCEDGSYQVWGKRKGHENKRFEKKTRREFEANEKFLSMSKTN
jgi:hypothetical protein